MVMRPAFEGRSQIDLDELLLSVVEDVRYEYDRYGAQRRGRTPHRNMPAVSGARMIEQRDVLKQGLSAVGR
jgi:hypothetical protein